MRTLPDTETTQTKDRPLRRPGARVVPIMSGRFLAAAVITIVMTLCLAATLADAQDLTEDSSNAGLVDGGRFDGYLFRDADGRPLPFQSDQAIEDFLSTARVASVTRIPEGVTDPRQLLLAGESMAVHAIFKDIDREERNVRDKTAGKNKYYLNWRDWYGYDIAAYRLDRALGLHRVPPVVERRIRNKLGSVQIWLEGVITDTIRRNEGYKPPSVARYNQQKEIMHVFDNLVANRDSNLGNTLIDSSWRLWFIDCSRCFGTSGDLLYPQAITHCERGLWEALKSLDRGDVEERLAPLLTDREIEALFKRRDKLVDHIQAMIDEWGELHILFDAVPPGEPAEWASD